MSCIFCGIVERKKPAKIIHEDELSIAFEDVHPQAPVHVLVIPRKHISSVLEIGAEDHALVGHLFAVAAKIAKEKGISERGFRLVMNCNTEAGQSVYHIHLHVLGGRWMRWPPG